MEQVQQQQVLLMAIASLKKDMDDIKRRLDGKTPTLLTEEAVEGFKSYLKENTKPNTRRSYDYLLEEFRKGFLGQNVSEIAPYRLQEFLAAKWGRGKRSVLKQSFSKLKWFFSWCVKYVQIKGMPPFLNPCELIEIKSIAPPERPEFVPVEKMVEFLETMKDERHWLITAILMAGGLRISEVIGDHRAGKPGLFKKDVEDRILAIRNPKSGRKEEIAVIPVWVSERLKHFLPNHGTEEKIFTISYATFHDVIRTHGKWVGLSITPHYLRKWCASFWQRVDEYAMTNFVLRHSSTKVGEATLVSSLGARYVASLSPQEVMEKQDRLFNLTVPLNNIADGLKAEEVEE